jgi:hypothetical protein
MLQRRMLNPNHCIMKVLEVRYNDGHWSLRESGAPRDSHTEPPRSLIGAYVEGYMTERAGKVIFYGENGGVEREALYEPRDLRWWGQRCPG